MGGGQPLKNVPNSLLAVHVPVENLANLLYLIRQESDRPEKILEYTAMADEQMAKLIAIVNELYSSTS